jgi:hypothetical protein
MLPKNKMRPFYLSKIEIFEEGGHNLHHLGLPQFGKVKALDYNKILKNPITGDAPKEKLKIKENNSTDTNKGKSDI